LFNNGFNAFAKAHYSAPPIVNLEVLVGQYNFCKIAGELLLYLFGMAKVPGLLGVKIEVAPTAK
jgi:hypothetical protein